MAIQTNTTIKSTPHFKLLSQDQIHELVRAAFDVMGKVGFKVLHPGARDMLKKAGAVVKDDRVKVPEFIVAGCLSTAPKGWTLFNRNGERALEVTGRNSYFGTSTASPNTKDALHGGIPPDHRGGPCPLGENRRRPREHRLGDAHGVLPGRSRQRGRPP